MDPPPQLRVFISSPGDVAEERERARAVVIQLQDFYGPDRVGLETLLWEDLPLSADTSFQAGIDVVLSASGVDVAVFILWSRLGSPLGPRLRKADGSEYRSGTEREFDLMLAAREATRARGEAARPELLVYVRDDEQGWRTRLDRARGLPELETLVTQRKLVEGFIREEFHDSQGHNTRAYHSYPAPQSFAERLKVHLRELIERCLEREPAPVLWEAAPYRGLETFEAEHARIFFGRELQTLEVIEQLDARRRAGEPAFVCLVGASGRGKSSLVRAGVTASLLASSDRWKTTIFLPRAADGALIAHLAQCLIAALPALRERVPSHAFVQGLTDNPANTLALSLAPLMENQGRLLVILDQLEECYTDARLGPEAREAFWRVVAALAELPQVVVVGTLRSDFYAHAQADPAFLALKGSHGHYDLGPLDGASLEAVIRRPARLAGLRFEVDANDGTSLDAHIVSEAGGEADVLPLLQYLLLELYQRRDPRQQLTFEAYRALGGVAGAIGRRAEAVYGALPPAVQATLPKLLRRLVVVEDGAVGATGRSVDLEEFAVNSPERALIEALAAPNARLLVTERDETTARIKVAHEAMLRSWLQVRTLIEADRERYITRMRLEADFNRWQAAGQTRDLLLPVGKPLSDAEALVAAWGGDLAAELIAYTSSSRAEVDRRSSVRRRLFVVTLLVFMSLTLVAAWQWKVAEAQRELAEQKTQEAETNWQRAERLLGDVRQAQVTAQQERDSARSSLAANLFDSAVRARDEMNSPVRAVHGFAAAADLSLDRVRREEARYATDWLARDSRTLALWRLNDSDGSVEVLYGSAGLELREGHELYDTNNNSLLATFTVVPSWLAGMAASSWTARETSFRTAPDAWDTARQVDDADPRRELLITVTSDEPGVQSVSVRRRSEEVLLARFVARMEAVKKSRGSGDVQSPLTIGRSAAGVIAIVDAPNATLRLDGPASRPQAALAQLGGDFRGLYLDGQGHRMLVWTGDTVYVARDDGRRLLAIDVGAGLVDAALSPDGHLVLAAHDDTQNRSSVAVWDAGTGERLTLPVMHRGVTSGSVSNDGRYLLTWGGHEWIEEMFASARVVHIPPPAIGRFKVGPGVALAADGPLEIYPPEGEYHRSRGERHMIFTHGGGRFEVVSTHDLRRRSRAQLANAPPGNWFASDDGSTLFVDPGNGRSVAWDAATGARLGDAPFGAERAEYERDISPSGRWYLDRASATLWNTRTGDVVALAVDGAVDQGYFSDDESKLLITTSGGVAMWSLGASVPAAFPEQTVCPGGHVLLLRSTARVICERHNPPASRLYDFHGHPIGEPVSGSLVQTGYGELSRDPNAALVRRGDGALQVWDLATGRVLGKALAGASDSDIEYQRFYLSNNRRRLLGIAKSQYRFWDVPTGASRNVDISGRQSFFVFQAQWAPHDRHVVISGGDPTTWIQGVVDVFDPDRGESLLFETALPSTAWARYLRDGERLLAHTYHNQVTLWDVPGRRELLSRDLKTGGFELTPDGSKMLIWNLREAQIWSTLSSAPLSPGFRPGFDIAWGVISDDGRSVLVGGVSDGREVTDLRLWRASAPSTATDGELLEFYQELTTGRLGTTADATQMRVLSDPLILLNSKTSGH